MCSSIMHNQVVSSVLTNMIFLCSELARHLVPSIMTVFMEKRHLQAHISLSWSRLSYYH